MNKFNGKMKALSILLSVLATTGAYAQANTNTQQSAATTSCKPAVQKEQYEMLMAALFVDDTATVSKLVAQNCYTFEYFKKFNLEQLGIFSARSKEMLEILEPHFEFFGERYTSMGFDTLTYYAIQKEIYKTVTLSEDIKALRSIYKKFGNTSLDKVTDQQIAAINDERAASNRDEMVSYLFDLQSKKGKNKVLPPTDVFGNEIMHYLVLMGDVKHLEKTLNSSTSGTVRKTRLLRVNIHEKLAPISMVFNIKQVYKDQAQQDALVAKINDLMLNELKNSRPFLNRLYVYENNFFALAEIMKDKNPDFYNKLKALYPNEKYTPVKAEEARKYYLEKSNFLKVAEKWMLDSNK